MTAVDIEAAIGGVYKPTVEAVKPSRSWIWTIAGVVFFLSLCAVASLCFAWHFTVSLKPRKKLVYTVMRFESEIR